MRGEEPAPISGRHDGTTILHPDQLADVTCCGLLDHTGQVVQRADVGSAKLLLMKPKQASGENFVWPAIMKCKWMDWCRPVSTLHMRYCTMVLFLFWPLELSACRLACDSPRPWWLKKKSSTLTTMFAPLPVSLASSIMKFTWRRMASQHTPKMAAFLGVRCRVGQALAGCWDSAPAAQNQKNNAPRWHY